MTLFDANATDQYDQPQVVLRGGTDNTAIGNREDAAKVTPDLIDRVDVASAARTVTGNTAALDSHGMGCLTFFINVTAVSGTTPKLQVSLEVSEDQSNWKEVTNTKQFTATGSERIPRIPMGARYYRFSWIISGTTPSFTFSINTVIKTPMPSRYGKLHKYADISLTTAGNVSSTFTAINNSTVSLMSVRGADGGNGTSWRVEVSNNEMDWAELNGNNINQNASQTVSQTFGPNAWIFYRLKVTGATNVGTRTLDLHWSST